MLWLAISGDHKLTGKGQLDYEQNACRHCHQVQVEIPMVIIPNAVVDPWTMAKRRVSKMASVDVYLSHWSCFATQRLQRRQCLLRRGRRIIQVVQKCSSSNAHSVMSSRIIAFCCASPFILGTKPGSANMLEKKK